MRAAAQLSGSSVGVHTLHPCGKLPPLPFPPSGESGARCACGVFQKAALMNFCAFSHEELRPSDLNMQREAKPANHSSARRLLLSCPPASFPSSSGSSVPALPYLPLSSYPFPPLFALLFPPMFSTSLSALSSHLLAFPAFPTRLWMGRRGAPLTMPPQTETTRALLGN